LKRAVILAAALAACTSTGHKRPLEQEPIEMIVSTEADTLDPRYVGDAVGLRTSRLIHAGLVRLDPETQAPIPYLAHSWHWVSDRVLYVELRDDLHFHSGAPFTSNDVAATLRAFASPAVGSRHAGVVDAILRAEPDGPHAVVITLNRPHATLLTDLELPILRADEAASPPDAKGNLDGLGPFRAARISRGEILLLPVDGGALSRPKHSVVLRTVHDENARALRLLAGRADVALNVLSPTVLASLESREDLSVTSRTGANLTYLVPRVDRGPLADARVRQALSLAIDRAGIAHSLLGGHAEPADTLIPRGHWAYSAPESPLAFDPAAARAELDAAGFVDPPGPAPRLRLTLLTSTDRLRGTIARYFAQELADVGVQIDVIPLELGTMLARLAAGDFELATLQLPEFTEPNVLRVFLHSAFVPPAGANRGRVHDLEVDALLDEGDRVVGVEARRAVYAALERRLRHELLIVPLWHEDQVAVTSTRARAFAPSAEGRWLALASLP
jgi:peptide/nickel transport system substrate-binding protein